MKANIFDYILDLPLTNSMAKHHKKITALLDDLGYPNLEFDAAGFYNNHDYFVIFINQQHGDLIVEKGLPMYIQVYGEISREIKATKLVKTWLEDDDCDDDAWEDLETCPFSWKALEDLLVKYHDYTY